MYYSWEEVRVERNRLLQESDWTQLPDVPDTIDRWSWTVYRYNLRNIPQKFLNPEDVVFPEPPPASQDTSGILGLGT